MRSAIRRVACFAAMPSAMQLTLFAQNLLLAALAALLIARFATQARAQTSVAAILARWRVYRRGVLAVAGGVLVALLNSVLDLSPPSFLLMNLIAYIGYYVGVLFMLQATYSGGDPLA